MKLKPVFLLTILVFLTTVTHATLLLHWKLDEVSGIAIHEEVNNTSSVASVQGSVTLGVTHLAPGDGTAIDVSIDTPASYIAAGSMTSNNVYQAADPGSHELSRTLATEWTITAWIKGDDWGDRKDRNILSEQWDFEYGFSFHVTKDGRIAMDFEGGEMPLGQTLAVDTCYFVAVRADSNESFGAGLKHSIDVWDGSVWSHVTGEKYSDIKLRNLEVGSFQGDRQFDGVIDDVRVYDHVLSQSELNTLVMLPVRRPTGRVSVR